MMTPAEKRKKLFGILVMLVLSGWFLYEGFSLLFSEREKSTERQAVP